MRWVVPRRALIGLVVVPCVLVLLILCIGQPERNRSQFMRAISVLRNENTIEASVGIDCPVEDVFRFYRDFANLPSFLGDVMAVEQIGPLDT